MYKIILFDFLNGNYYHVFRDTQSEVREYEATISRGCGLAIVNVIWQDML